MGGDIFDILCCICSCVCDEDANNCCIGTVGCLGIFCASYKKNISGNGQRRFKFLNKVIIFIFSIVAIVLSTITVVEFNSTTFNFSSIFENWKLGAIVDIKVQNICDDGYETLSIYESPKTVKGCICSDDISQGDCTDFEYITGCTVKAPQDPLILDRWVQKGNNSYYQAQICGKRSKLTFYELIEKQIISEQDCINNGYKVCKTNNIENSYCVLQDEDCPVRDVKISEVELSYEEILLKNYEKIYDQGFYTYLTRNLDIFPIINAAIVKGKGVCLDEDEISLNAELEEDYELLYPQPSNCELDDSFQNIAEITEAELFKLNGLSHTIELAWPQYEISKKVIYKLMMQNQIQYKLQCRQSNFESLNQISDNLDSLKSILICQTVFAYIFFCIMTFLVIADMTRICYEDCRCIKKYLYLIIQLTSLYLMSVTIIVSYSYLAYIKPKIQDEVDKNCFSKGSQSKLKFILDQINNKGQTLTSSLFIICIIVIVIDFIMETFVCFKKVKRYRFNRTQRTLDQYNNNNEIPQQDPFQNQEQNMYHNQQPNVNSYQYPDKQNFQNQQNYNPYQIPQQANYNYPNQNNNYISDNQYNPHNQQNQNNQEQDLIQFEQTLK